MRGKGRPKSSKRIEMSVKLNTGAVTVPIELAVQYQHFLNANELTMSQGIRLAINALLGNKENEAESETP